MSAILLNSLQSASLCLMINGIYSSLAHHPASAQQAVAPVVFFHHVMHVLKWFFQNFHSHCHETAPESGGLWKKPQERFMPQRQVLVNPDTPTHNTSPSAATAASHRPRRFSSSLYLARNLLSARVLSTCIPIKSRCICLSELLCLRSSPLE